MDSPGQLQACEAELRKMCEIGKLAAETVEQVRYMNNKLQADVKYARAELQPYIENGKKWKRRAYYWKERWAQKCEEHDRREKNRSLYVSKVSELSRDLDEKEKVINGLLLEISKLKEVSPE